MPNQDPDSKPTLQGYEVLLCVCGGIAAYKSATLVSRLVQAGCGVTVAMSRAARRFVGRATFEALSGRAVVTSMWGGSGEIQHLKHSERSDLIVVAPATANTLGKLAGGLADDLIGALLLGADCPAILAPAMNTHMWAHPAVQRNVGWLSENGYELVGPNSGWQACRAVGAGRMVEPEELLEVVRARLLERPPRNGGS